MRISSFLKTTTCVVQPRLASTIECLLLIWLVRPKLTSARLSKQTKSWNLRPRISLLPIFQRSSWETSLSSSTKGSRILELNYLQTGWFRLNRIIGLKLYRQIISPRANPNLILTSTLLGICRNWYANPEVIITASSISKIQETQIRPSNMIKMAEKANLNWDITTKFKILVSW